MFNKIVFLCVDPWENFLSHNVQGHSRKYFELVKKGLLLKDIKLQCGEYMDLYGETTENREIFKKNSKILQLSYIQSSRRELLEEVFHSADMVIMGIPGSRKEFEKIYMSIFPWKDNILFLWSSQVIRKPSYLERLSREYMIRQEHVVEIRKNMQLFGE